MAKITSEKACGALLILEGSNPKIPLERDSLVFLLSCWELTEAQLCPKLALECVCVCLAVMELLEAKVCALR